MCLCATEVVTVRAGYWLDLNEACSGEQGWIGPAVWARVCMCVHETVKLIKSGVNTDRKQWSRGEWKLGKALGWND